MYDTLSLKSEDSVHRCVGDSAYALIVYCKCACSKV